MPKWKPQIESLFQNVLHILGQEKYSSLRTRLLHATACRGYHEFNKKPGYYIVQILVITLVITVVKAFNYIVLLLKATLYS